MTPVFEEFPKIARLSRRCVITEKIDGTTRPTDRQKLARARRRQREADGLLAVWFWEMSGDHEDGSYQCTCEPDDHCPMHRLAAYVVKHKPRGCHIVEEAAALLPARRRIGGAK